MSLLHRLLHALASRLLRWGAMLAQIGAPQAEPPRRDEAPASEPAQDARAIWEAMTAHIPASAWQGVRAGDPGAGARGPRAGVDMRAALRRQAARQRPDPAAAPMRLEPRPAAPAVAQLAPMTQPSRRWPASLLSKWLERMRGTATDSERATRTPSAPGTSRSAGVTPSLSSVELALKPAPVAAAHPPMPQRTASESGPRSNIDQGRFEPQAPASGRSTNDAFSHAWTKTTSPNFIARVPRTPQPLGAEAPPAGHVARAASAPASSFAARPPRAQDEPTRPSAPRAVPHDPIDAEWSTPPGDYPGRAMPAPSIEVVSNPTPMHWPDLPPWPSSVATLEAVDRGSAARLQRLQAEQRG